MEILLKKYLNNLFRNISVLLAIKQYESNYLLFNFI